MNINGNLKIWKFEKNDKGNVYIYTNGTRCKKTPEEPFEEVTFIKKGNDGEELVFYFAGERNGKHFRRSMFKEDANALCSLIKTARTNREFINTLKINSNIKKGQLKDTSKLAPDEAPENELDKGIKLAFKGTYNIPVLILENAPTKLQMRPIQKAWVNYLKSDMRSMPTKPVTQIGRERMVCQPTLCMHVLVTGV
ncbi:unnamed protein product [Owenia fusiformis]|uniref:Uncharacterized protein n=1 Tax=Owenia fusiformis TaxID=6347 RepID=A0A8J1XNX4_OWEFU|nr:unnamed protein product [Owenia fusiformis]